MSTFWRISDFAKQIGKHVNTVDGWFKTLEEKKIHYVNRTNDTEEKIYDEFDLKVGLYIKGRRDKKWSLTAIYDALQEDLELRPFPKEEEGSTYTPQIVDMTKLKEQLFFELQESFEQVAATKIQEIKEHYETMFNQLPKPQSHEDQKEQRFQDLVTRRRVETKLEEEANHMWTQKPEEERIKKTGWFRREENWYARDRFVRHYVNQHFEEYLRKELE